jgi:hypothetical protein
MLFYNFLFLQYLCWLDRSLFSKWYEKPWFLPHLILFNKWCLIPIDFRPEYKSLWIASHKINGKYLNGLGAPNVTYGR